MDERERQLLCESIRNGAFQEIEPIDLLRGMRGASEIPDSERTVYSWFLSQQGEWVAARKVALTISDPDESGQALAVLAQRLVTMGLLEDAADAIRLINLDSAGRGAFTETLQARIDLSTKIAETATRKNLHGDLAEIEEMIGQRNRADALQVAFLLEVAEIWLRLDRKDRCIDFLDRAVEIARQATTELYEKAGVSDMDTWQVLKGVARTLVSLSEFERARTALAIITDGAYRERSAQQLGLS